MIREFIRKNWQSMSDLEMCKSLCISHSKVEKTRRKMRLLRQPGLMTPHDIRYIAENYYELTDAQMAKAIGVSENTVEEYRQDMKLFRRGGRSGNVVGITSASAFVALCTERIRGARVEGEEAAYFLRTMIMQRLREIRKVTQTYNLELSDELRRSDVTLRRLYDLQRDLATHLR